MQTSFFHFEAGSCVTLLGLLPGEKFFGGKGGLLAARRRLPPAAAVLFASAYPASLYRAVRGQSLGIRSGGSKRVRAAVGAALFEIEDGSERAEGELVAMQDGVAADALAIDEGAGGGIGIEQLDAAVGIADEFGMVLGNTVVIDHHVVVVLAPEGDVLRQGDHDFLAIFENKSEFCHGCA